MSIEEIEEIFENADYPYQDGVDSVLEGMKILSKYTKHSVIEGADHDIIWSLSTEKLTEISREDIELLAKYNWHIDHESECIAHFV